MKILNFFQKHWLICSVILVSVFARLIYLFDWHEIWWDSGVYFGMAKYLWSFGQLGLWEDIRPVFWPLFIGIGWWFKLNIVWFSRIIEFLLAIISTILVYAIARKVFSQRTAVISGIIWAFSSIVFYMSFHEYTELPEVTLILAAVLAFVYSRFFVAGIFAGLAFLTKFPAGMFLVILGICLVFQKKWKKLIPLALGFVIPAIPFLVFNQLMYGSMLDPILKAHKSILLVVGCNILRYKPWYQYFGWILFDNVLNIFALLGIIVAVKNWKKEYFVPLLGLLLPLAYFMQLHCRDYRYLVMFLPFVILFTGFGIDKIVELLEKNKKITKHVWSVVLVLVLVVSVMHAMIFYHHNEPRSPDLAAERYYQWLEGRELSGEIWASNPVVAAYTDQKVNKIYYPIYGKETAEDFNKYLEANSQKISAILLDNCGGGLVCSPDDEQCPVEIEKMRMFLNENYKQVYFDISGRCWYSVYAK